MRRQGYSAVQEDVTGYNPDKTYDLILLSHLPTVEPPVLEPNLSENGQLICRTKARAKKLRGREDLELQAVYRESVEDMVEKRNFETLQQPELYLFK
jgi:protein-L-isoaspartate O-methyltransferase